MIRVLHVIDHLGLGGAQTAVLDMLKNRDRSVFAVEVAVLHGRGPFADALEEAGVPVHSLAPAKWPPVFVPAFLRLLHRNPYDVLHFHLQASNWILKTLAALDGAPVRIAHDHTSGDLRFRGVPSLFPDGITHRFSSRVIAVSDGVRSFLEEWEAVPSDAIQVIPNGVDDAVFCPGSDAERRAARTRLGLPERGVVIGGMGRLAYEKHFALFPRLAADHPELHFVIAGAGPEERRLKELVRSCGVGDRVTLAGSVSDRPGFYHALDVFLLPSLHEGLPMALLEAMASGVPVLASRLEGIAAALEADREGLLAGAGNGEEFSRQLARLAEDPALRARLAGAARDKVVRCFSAAWTARAVEAVYRAELGIAPGDQPARYSPE